MSTPPRLRFCHPLLVTVTLLLPTPSARAKPETAGSNESARSRAWARGVSKQERQLADRLFKSGNAFLEKLQYARALAHYRRAVKHWDHPATRYNMTICLINLDRPLEAYRSLQRALAFGMAPLGKALFRQAATYHKLLTGQIAYVDLSCEEPGAKVSLDGKPIMSCPGKKKLMLRPGVHQLVAMKEGFLTWSESIVLAPKARQRHQVKLQRLSDLVVVRRRWAAWKPWAVVATGVAIALSAIPFYLQALGNFQSYDDSVISACTKGCLPGVKYENIDQGALSRGQAFSTASTATAIAGAALSATGLVLVLLNQPRRVAASDTHAPRTSAGLFKAPTWVIAPHRLGAMFALTF